MRVLVTGTSGRVGSVTARHFLESGYDVRVLDRNPPPEDLRGKVEAVYGDITDRYTVLKAAEGCEGGIAHLAAIPNPGPMDNMIFPINVTGTQYILDAAESHGIRRVAIASTCCAFGIFFALNQIDPQYLPMDEKHSSVPQDLYGLSKLLNEETAAAYTRRSGMTTVSLRLTTVINFDSPHMQWWRRGLGSDEHRRNDLWSYVETHDVARAFRLALEKAPEGTNNTVIIAARDSFTGHDIRHLVRKHFPALADQVEHLEPTASLYDTRLAEQVMGWVAERNWRDVPELREAAAAAGKG